MNSSGERNALDGENCQGSRTGPTCNICNYFAHFQRVSFAPKTTPIAGTCYLFTYCDVVGVSTTIIRSSPPSIDGHYRGNLDLRLHLLRLTENEWLQSDGGSRRNNGSVWSVHAPGSCTDMQKRDAEHSHNETCVALPLVADPTILRQ